MSSAGVAYLICESSERQAGSTTGETTAQASDPLDRERLVEAARRHRAALCAVRGVGE